MADVGKMNYHQMAELNLSSLMSSYIRVLYKLRLFFVTRLQSTPNKHCPMFQYPADVITKDTDST